MHVHKGTVYPSTDRCPHCWRLSMIDLEKAQAEVKRLEADNAQLKDTIDLLSTSTVGELQAEVTRLKRHCMEWTSHHEAGAHDLFCPAWCDFGNKLREHDKQLTIAREALETIIKSNRSAFATTDISDRIAREALEQIDGK